MKIQPQQLWSWGTVLLYLAWQGLAFCVSSYALFLLSLAYWRLLWVPIILMVPALLFLKRPRLFSLLLWGQALLVAGLFLIRILLDLWLPVDI